MRPERYPVAVFAYNLAPDIAHCLDSIFAGGLGRAVEVHVLVNGCTDDTADVVRDYSRRHAEVQCHIIEAGDKANAWNVYVHEIARPASAHLFVDGDVEVRPHALSALLHVLDANPVVNAVSSLPDSGRNSGRWIDKIVEAHGLTGNLYALRGEFVDRIRAIGLRLPFGLIGDDSWVGAFAAFDLDTSRGWVKERIAICRDARFHYDSLVWYRPRDLRLYWRRRFRYAYRTWQTRLLRHQLSDGGFASIPAEVDELYRRYPDLLTLRWEGLDTFFLWRTRQRIRSFLASR
jgi:glycosyltransferase involved in cell wall biosynthesis